MVADNAPAVRAGQSGRATATAPNAYKVGASDRHRRFSTPVFKIRVHKSASLRVRRKIQGADTTHRSWICSWPFFSSGFRLMFARFPTRWVLALAAGAVFLSGCGEETTCTGIINPVRTLSATPASLELDVGATASVGATFSSSCADDNPAVLWTSSDTTVVRVVSTASGSVTVTAVRPGPATLNATAVGPSSTSVPVTVRTPVVQAITLSSNTLRVRERRTVTLTATVASTGLLSRQVTFASQAPGVATIAPIDSVSATITGVAVGVTTITVTSVSDPTKTATATLAVDAALVATVTIGGLTLPDSLLLGTTRQLTATVRDSLGVELAPRTATWASLSPSVLSVTPNGELRAVSAGVAQVTATVPIGDSSGTRVATAAVGVYGALQVVVSPRAASVQEGQTVALAATVTGTAGIPRTVTWESSVPSRATVSSTGVVTGVTANATPVVIRARSTAVPDVVDSASITVISSSVPTALTVAPRTDTLSPQGTRTLTAIVRDQRGVVLPGVGVSWRALNPTLATVSGAGVVTAVANGTAQIVVSALRAGTDSLRDTATFQIVAPCTRVRTVALGTTYTGTFDASSCRAFLGFPGNLDQFSVTSATQAYYAVALTPTLAGSLVPLNIGSAFFGLPAAANATTSGLVVTKPGTFGLMVASQAALPGTYVVSTTLNPDARQNCLTTESTRGVSFQTALIPTCRQRDIRILPQLGALRRVIVTARAPSFAARIELLDFSTGATLATAQAAATGGTATINYLSLTSRFVVVRVIASASVNDYVTITIDDQ
jgi:uncharacterized protein YjdB